MPGGVVRRALAVVAPDLVVEAPAEEPVAGVGEVGKKGGKKKKKGGDEPAPAAGANEEGGSEA